MFNIIFKIYAYLFGRTIFRKFNIFLYHLGLRGLGVLNFQDEYLTGEKYWLKNYLKNIKNPIVFDIGANIGTYSKNILKANKESFIYAFEPHPKTYKILTSSIDNLKFKAFNNGVGDKNEKLELYDYDTKDGSSHASLYKNVIKDIHKSNSISHTVDIIKLDQFITEQKILNIDLLKIDTEGNELNVIVGCLKTINKKKIKAIHFEFNEMNIISKASFKDFWDILYDYQFYRILPGGKLLPIKNYTPIACEIYAFQNIVAVLKEN